MAAVIACSPIVWLHYFALLVVVVAVAQPRLGLAWFVPLLMYGAEEIGNGSPAQTAVTLGASAAHGRARASVARETRARRGGCRAGAAPR